nr:hypothetical protein [Tanacetum cinerariifolium]
MPPSPPPPSSTNQESPSKGSAAQSPSKTVASAKYQAWTTTTDIRLRPSISLTLADLKMDEDMAPDEQAQSSDDADIGSSHILTVNLRQGDRSTVRTHMRILSVVRIEVFSMYGYGYMKKIVLRRADLNEHGIAERDFKYLYPSDFEDLYLLNLQGHLNHLSPKDKKLLTTAMMMRFNEIHKFSDGTLLQIDEALDYRVKEFRISRLNPEAFEDTEDLPQPGELCWRT